MLLGDQQFGCAELGGSGCSQFIPDGAQPGLARISSTLTVPVTPLCPYRSAFVAVFGLHSAPGDLELRLRHVESGIDITQPAVAGVGNLSGTDLDRTIPLPSLLPGTPVAGTWQLEIEDRYANNYGHLIDWRVVLDCPIEKSVLEPGGSVPDLAEPGETLRYQIRLRNDSPWAITTLVTDPVPAGVSFVAANQGGTLVGNTVTWSALSVPAATTLTLTFDVLVDALPPPGQFYISNRATVGAEPTSCEGGGCEVTSIVRVEAVFQDGFESP